MTKNLSLPRAMLPLALASALTLMLQACSSGIGPAQQAPGPMGSTATGSQADLPDSNSQSLPIEKPLGKTK